MATLLDISTLDLANVCRIVRLWGRGVLVEAARHERGLHAREAAFLHDLRKGR